LVKLLHNSSFIEPFYLTSWANRYTNWQHNKRKYIMCKTWAMPSNKQTEQEKRLIQEALDAGKVTVVRPGAAPGSEMSRSTRERVAAARRKFRKENKQ
jgi:hypothetical protein